MEEKEEEEEEEKGGAENNDLIVKYKLIFILDKNSNLGIDKGTVAEIFERLNNVSGKDFVIASCISIA